MFRKSEAELMELGAIITTGEIKQQPELWQEVLTIYQTESARITKFLSEIREKHSRAQVIFTGAGSSAYVGEIVKPFLKERHDGEFFDFQDVPTTDLVTNPKSYFKRKVPTILVSFARSGNSPESLAAVDLGMKLTNDFYQITITCAVDGKLSLRSKGDEKNLLLIMPDAANDQGFAMTGSLTCMTLMSLLVFDTHTDDEKATYVSQISTLAAEIIEREDEIRNILPADFERVIYLGSGSFAGLAREVQLKILELTAGQIATLYDSSLGFRHGPKSFVNERALVFMFISNDKYTRQYDLDMLHEISGDKIAPVVYSISTEQATNFQGESFSVAAEYSDLPDGYLCLPFAVVGQIISLLTAVKLGNKPDTPSPTGTVNRVVKGVTIYDNLNS